MYVILRDRVCSRSSQSWRKEGRPRACCSASTAVDIIAVVGCVAECCYSWNRQYAVVHFCSTLTGTVVGPITELCHKYVKS